jgi:deoxyribose-phosphate aldolase
VHDEELIERIARRVLESLRTGGAPEFAGVAGCAGADCTCRDGGECPRRRPATLRRIVAAGACRVAQRFPGGPVEDDLAVCIDHTLLRPEATYAQVEQLCHEAAQYRFASVCINPVHVAACAAMLRGTGVAVCTVVGFPLGATTTAVKVFETRQAVDDGAREIDMVIHVGALKSGDLDAVYEDIRRVGQACGRDALLKVIIEAALLDDDEKVRACVLAAQAGADFVKTSTGFGPGGATLHDVDLMRRAVGDDLGVKAAGGIRDRATAEQMIAAGADRVGASASVKILRERDAPRS